MDSANSGASTHDQHEHEHEHEHESLDLRARAADERDRAADERELLADARDVLADARERDLAKREQEVEQLAEPTPEGLAAGLTEREHGVLELLAEGRSNEEIGRALFIGVNTVKTHLKVIYLRLGVHTRAQATRWFTDNRPPRPGGGDRTAT